LNKLLEQGNIFYLFSEIRS